MRKVFIIGNGFDRAHGLETSYQHLIDYYKSKVFWRLRSETSYADSFLKVDLPGPPLEHEHYERHGPRNFDELEKHTETKGEVLEYKGSFMSDLIKHYNDSNWVDIEYYYFLKLKQVALNDTPTMEWKKESLVALNAQFKALKGLLTEYLDSTNLKV